MSDIRTTSWNGNVWLGNGAMLATDGQFSAFLELLFVLCGLTAEIAEKIQIASWFPVSGLFTR